MELKCSSLSVISQESDCKRYITLEFSLKAAPKNSGLTLAKGDMEIAEMVLVFNERLEFIDERRVVNVTSPYVTAFKGT